MDYEWIIIIGLISLNLFTLIKYIKAMLKVYSLLKLAYTTILRDLVVKAIDNPDSEVDDFVLKMLDKLFDHQ